MSTTVRISRETHERLATLASLTGRRMQAIIEDAVTAYEANSFWEGFTAGYERITEDPRQWAEVQAERIGEEPALADQPSGS